MKKIREKGGRQRKRGGKGDLGKREETREGTKVSKVREREGEER